MSQLNEKTALVTGGGSGIGRAISETFAAAGAAVAILDLDEATAAETVAAIQAGGGKAAFFRCDVSEASSVSAAVEGATQAFGAPGILVNNAGIANIGTATNTSESDFDRVMRVNVKGVYLCLQAVLPLMVEAGGGVVLNLSSIAAITGLKDRFAYSASKGAVHTMTLSKSSRRSSRSGAWPVPMRSRNSPSISAVTTPPTSPRSPTTSTGAT
jgi:NAD(P)-dependent dehydrogenase (short-subunit alcohol dehydrogenase family)